MAAHKRNKMSNFGDSCLKCQVYRFRKKLILQNIQHIYLSPDYNWLGIHYYDNALFLWSLKIKTFPEDGLIIDNVKSFCWKQNLRQSADENIVCVTSTRNDTLTEHSISSSGMLLSNQLSIDTLKNELQHKGVTSCNEVRLLTSSLDTYLFLVDLSIIVEAKFSKDSCDVNIISRISSKQKETCSFSYFQLSSNQVAIFNKTENTISVLETGSSHFLYQIDLVHTKLDLSNIICWNVSHDLQKLVLLSSEWLIHIVSLPGYIQSFPRSLLTDTHIPRDQLFYQKVHSVQTSDVNWKEKLTSTSLEKQISYTKQNKQTKHFSGYGKDRISGFKKNTSSVTKAVQLDTIIDTFELPSCLSDWKAVNMVVGEFSIAMELHSSEGKEKCLCLFDSQSQKSIFQSLSNNEQLILSDSNSFPHMIISEQFLYHIVMHPGMEHEDFVNKMMVYGGATSADTLCDLNKWSRCTVPLHALETGLKHRQLDTVAFFLKSKEKLFSKVKQKPVSPTSPTDETSVWQQQNCYQDNLKPLESALLLLIEAIRTNISYRQSQEFGNQLLSLTLEYLYRLLLDGLVVRSGLGDAEDDCKEREDLEKAIEVVMGYTSKIRQCLQSCNKHNTETLPVTEMNDGYQESTEYSRWKGVEPQEALESAILENQVSQLQIHLMMSDNEDDATYSKVVKHGITQIMSHLKKHEMEEARKMLLNLGFEVTPKLWELAQFVHDRDIQTFILEQLQKSSGLDSGQSALLEYFQKLYDQYPCSSFTHAVKRKQETSSSQWSDSNPLAECMIEKSSLTLHCGDIGHSDTQHSQGDSLYSEILIHWLQWWDDETRESVLLDSYLSKPDFQMESYPNKNLLFKYLLSHNMVDETLRLLDWVLDKFTLKHRSRQQCVEILQSLTNQLNLCGSYLRNKICIRLLRSGYIPVELLADFSRLLHQLSVTGGVLQVPHPLHHTDSLLQVFHKQFISYCAASHFILPLWRYCSIHRIHPNQFSLDDERNAEWLSNFNNFFSISKNPEDRELMFSASMSNARLIWHMDECTLADLFHEGHDLAAIATLPYYSPPITQSTEVNSLGDLYGAMDPAVLESKLKIYPKLQAALYPESSKDIDVYQLLVGNAPFDPRRLFGWQTSNSVAGEDCCKEMPYFSQPDLVSKFAYNQKLRFPFYLKHSRPSYAFFSFLAMEVESGEGSISTKRIQTACGIALVLAVKNLTHHEIASSCSAFVEMLGQDSLLIRVYVSVGSKLLAHRKTGLKGTAEKMRDELKKNEQEIIDLLLKCIKNRRRHGSRLLVLLEEAVSSELSHKKIYSTSFEAGRKWFLPVLFCNQLGLPLTTRFLEECAQSDMWLLFIWFSQLHQYPKHQLQSLLHHFKSRNLREHLHYVIENADVQSMISKKKPPSQQTDQSRDTRSSLYAKIGLAKEKNEGESSEDESSEQPEQTPASANHSPTDADLYVSEDAAPDDVFQVIFSSQASRCPWKSLLFHAVSLRNMLFAELAACYTDSSVLVCLCGWLVAMLDKPTYKQFLEDHGKIASGWGMTHLESLIDIYLKHKWEFTLATGFDIFQTSSPMLPFLRFVAECSQQRNYTKSKKYLEEFKDAMSSFSQQNRHEGTTAAVQPVVIGDQEWLEKTTNQILQNQLLRSCHLYDTVHLLRLLDQENIALVYSFDVLDYSRLHKLAQILHSCEIEDVNFQPFLLKSEQQFETEAVKAITKLTEKSCFDEARKFAVLTEVKADFITLKQLALEKQELENSMLWRSKGSRLKFWKHCVDCFTKQKITSDEVVKFFLSEAESVDNMTEKATVYEECLKQLNEVDSENTDMYVDNIYQKMWQCRIQAKLQESEEVLIAPDAVEEIMSGMETLETSRSTEDKSELLYFGRMPVSSKSSLLSKEESGALDSLVGELLNNGQIREACKVTAVFGHKSQDLAIILTCIRLSLHIQTVDGIDEEMRQLLTSRDKGRVGTGSFSGAVPRFPHSASSLSLASAAPHWDFLPADKEEVIITMEMLLSNCVQGQHCCLRIVTAYKVACLLNRTYEDIVISKEFTVLGDLLKVTTFQHRFSLARDYLSTSSLSDNQVSSFLADSIITALKIGLAGHAGQDPKFGSSNPDLIFNPQDGMAVFDQFIKLCQDPSKLGNHLLDAVAAISSNQTESSYTDLSVQTELLVLAHECFTVACSMEGISNVLRAARTTTEVLAVSQEFSLMIRLLTGIGRFNEMTYIFDALIHHEQFELLLRKGMEKEDKLKIAILDYLKRFHPKDNENYTMVALNFTMFREIAQMLEENGHRHIEILKDKPLENIKEVQDILKKSIVYFSDAADSYIKEDCVRHAQQCIRQARLLALQLQHLSSGLVLINLSADDVTNLLNQHPKFSECLIISEAYGKRADWAIAIYYNVIVNGDFRFLQDLKSHIRLVPSMIADAVERYRQLGPFNPQCLSNIKKLLPFCKDVKTQYAIAKDLGFNDIIANMLKPETGSYLQDIINES